MSLSRSWGKWTSPGIFAHSINWSPARIYLFLASKSSDRFRPLPGEELVACEEVLRWLKRARGAELLPFSDMEAGVFNGRRIVGGRTELDSVQRPFGVPSLGLEMLLLGSLFLAVRLQDPFCGEATRRLLKRQGFDFVETRD